MPDARPRRRTLRRLLVVGALALGLGVAGAAPAAADNCSGPDDCEQTGGYNGAIAVVGGVAAVAAAAAAAANAGNGDADGDSEEDELAIVQVSEDEIDVFFDEPAQLELTGWNAKGGKIERVAMDLWIDVPPDSGLLVTPEQGTGQLIAQLTLDEATYDPERLEVLIVANGSWEGKQASQDVIVYLWGDDELHLWDGGLPQLDDDDFDEGDLRA
jgi:hypothetical protein